MPSGKTHNKINQSLLITTILISIFRPHPWLWLFDLGFAIGVNYLGPDLDQNNSMQDQNWGIYGIYWNIYAAIMPHRGFSHSVFGVVSRLLFLFPLIFLGFIINQLGSEIMSIQDIWRSIISFIKSYKIEIIFFILGILFADVLHIMEDIIFHRIKI